MSSSLRSRRWSSLALSACSLLGVAVIGTACGPAPSGMRMIPVGAAVAPAAPERSSFSVPLVAADGGAGNAVGQGTGTASISVRNDNVLVYSVDVNNAANESFTQAQLVRVTPDSVIDVIATLFSDIVFRNRYISIRGTATLARTLPPDALLAHVREHPDEYRLIVRSERHPAGTLVGFLGTAR